MAEFDLTLPELPPNPNNADLGRAIIASFHAIKQTHDCLELLRKDKRDSELVLSGQIKSMNDQFAAVKDQHDRLIKAQILSSRQINKNNKQIDRLTTAVGDVNTKVDSATLSADATAKIVKSITDGFAGIKKSGAKFAVTVCAGLIIAAGTVVIQNSINHNSTVQAIARK